MHEAAKLASCAEWHAVAHATFFPDGAKIENACQRKSKFQKTIKQFHQQV